MERKSFISFLIEVDMFADKQQRQASKSSNIIHDEYQKYVNQEKTAKMLHSTLMGHYTNLENVLMKKIVDIELAGTPIDNTVTLKEVLEYCGVKFEGGLLGITGPARMFVMPSSMFSDAINIVKKTFIPVYKRYVSIKDKIKQTREVMYEILSSQDWDNIDSNLVPSPPNRKFTASSEHTLLVPNVEPKSISSVWLDEIVDHGEIVISQLNHFLSLANIAPINTIFEKPNRFVMTNPTTDVFVEGSPGRSLGYLNVYIQGKHLIFKQPDLYHWLNLMYKEIVGSKK